MLLLLTLVNVHLLLLEEIRAVGRHVGRLAVHDRDKLTDELMELLTRGKITGKNSINSMLKYKNKPKLKLQIKFLIIIGSIGFFFTTA